MEKDGNKASVQYENKYMKVNVEREVDLNRLLINLNEKSQCKNPGMAGYEVTVSKQLLRDAHDVISQFIKEKPDITFDANGLNFIYRQ